MQEEEDGWWGIRRVPAAPVPLRVRQAGIDVATEVPGDLLAWHQTVTGAWFALTRFEITNRAEWASLMLTQLVPAAVVRPAQSV